MCDKNKQPLLWDLMILFFIVGGFFLIMLGQRPLTSPDENRYAGAAFFMLQQHNWITPKLNGIPFLDKPILYYWLEMLSMKVFGVNNWAIRLPQMLFGLFGVLFTYYTTAKLFGRMSARFAAAILATSILYFVYCHYSNMSLEVAVLIASSMFSFILAQRSSENRAHQRNWMLAAFVFAAFALLTKGLMALAFPGMVIVVWVVTLRRWQVLRQLHLLGGISLFVIITAPWLYLVQQQNPWFAEYFFYYQQVHRFLATGFNNPMPIWFYLPVLFLAFYPWSLLGLPQLIKLRSLWQHRQQYAETWFLALWVILITLFFSIPQSKIVDYILPVLPALAILLGQFLAGQWLAPSRSTKIMIGLNAFIALALVVVIMLLPKLNTKVPADILTYTKLLSGVLLISAGLSLIWLMRNKTQRVLVLWLLALAAFNLIALSAMPVADKTSITPLIEKVKPQIGPHTQVYSYFTYYHELPFVLDRTITIAYPWQDTQMIMQQDNWARELYLGSQRDPSSAEHLITLKQFQQRWRDNKGKLIIFADRFRWAEIQHWQPKPHLLAEYNKAIVFTN